MVVRRELSLPKTPSTFRAKDLHLFPLSRIGRTIRNSRDTLLNSSRIEMWACETPYLILGLSSGAFRAGLFGEQGAAEQGAEALDKVLVA